MLGQGPLLVEWADQIQEALPDEYLMDENALDQ